MSFSDFPDDVLLEIAVKLPPISLVHFLSSSKRLWTVHSRAFPLKRIHKYKLYAKRFNWNKGLEEATNNNHLDCIEFFIRKGANNFNETMAIAAGNANMELVQYFISKGATNWDKGLEYGVLGRHKHIIKFFIQQGAKDWSRPMFSASREGDKDMVEYLMKQWIYDHDYKGGKVLVQGLLGAATAGHQDLIELFVDKTTFTQLDWENAFIAAIGGGKLNSVKFVYPKLANGQTDYGLLYACKCGYVDIVEYLLYQQGTDCIKRAMKFACEGNQLEVLKLLIKNVPQDRLLDALNEGLRCSTVNEKLVNFFIEQGANDWNGALHVAALALRKDMTQLFINKGADKFDKTIAKLQELMSVKDDEYWKMITMLQNAKLKRTIHSK